MCYNGDGSYRDDDEWCTMSGALNIKKAILKL